MKLNILGTEYDYEETSDKRDARLCDFDGYCDGYEKRIAIEIEYNENLPGATKDLISLGKKAKRHETIHAYLFESGLKEYSENELLVDWIAWQFPKMIETFNKIGAL